MGAGQDRGTDGRALSSVCCPHSTPLRLAAVSWAPRLRSQPRPLPSALTCQVTGELLCSAAALPAVFSSREAQLRSAPRDRLHPLPEPRRGASVGLAVAAAHATPHGKVRQSFGSSGHSHRRR